MPRVPKLLTNTPPGKPAVDSRPGHTSSRLDQRGKGKPGGGNDQYTEETLGPPKGTKRLRSSNDGADGLRKDLEPKNILSCNHDQNQGEEIKTIIPGQSLEQHIGLERTKLGHGLKPSLSLELEQGPEDSPPPLELNLNLKLLKKHPGHPPLASPAALTSIPHRTQQQD